MWRLTNVLLSHGADASIVNSDGELPIDLADGDRTKSILQEEMTRLGLDASKKEELLKAPEIALLAHIKELVAAREDKNKLDETGHALVCSFNPFVAMAFSSSTLTRYIYIYI
jgi:hypothetical protein